MSSRVLVLGGTGLLGHATTRELVSRGYTVTSVALPPMPTEDLFEEFGDAVDSRLADVTEMSDQEVLELLEGCYAVMYAIGADERVTPPAPAPASSTRPTCCPPSAWRPWPARPG